MGVIEFIYASIWLWRKLRLLRTFGALVYLLNGRIGLTTLFGAAFSILIEVSQYLFQLGFSDIDDFLFNTLGAAAGACIAAWAGPRSRWLWISLTAVLVVVFAVLIILGPRLGDPDRVVEVNAASYTMDHRSPLFI